MQLSAGLSVLGSTSLPCRHSNWLIIVRLWPSLLLRGMEIDRFMVFPVAGLLPRVRYVGELRGWVFSLVLGYWYSCIIIGDVR